tara:strand:- start:15369 stop:16202 length:834 start_codon:yes stop_codon:yes gene_type:complete
MQQLIYFFRKYRYFLFFLLLEILALALIINNLSFHKSKFVSSANNITGGFYNKANSISDYFQLDNENKELTEENVALKNRVHQLEQQNETLRKDNVLDTTKFNQRYSYIHGTIENNEYSKNYNFLLIDLGLKDSISTEMAVINSKGIIGITENISNNYSRVQSILNIKSNINARLKNDTHFGSLTWNGKDYNIVQLLDLPRQAVIKAGDTIITGGKSAIFPEGILIGRVLNIEEGGTSVTRIVNIKLFNDMSNLKNIYVIKDFDKEEIRTLESQKNE